MTEETKPLDISEFFMTQNFNEKVGQKKILTTVKVRRPPRQIFVQTHPEENMRCKVMVIELTEKQESYLVHPELEGDLFEEGVYKELITTIDRHGNVSLWPIRLESPDGQLDDWSRSAAAAALSAQTQWTRIVSNRQLGAYEIFTATGDLPPPQWPDKSFEELCEIAFPDDRRIHTLEHPAVRQLRGEE